VIATVRGWLTNEGGRLESVETGVALLIPPGALPPGPSHLVYFKVCRPDIQTVAMAPLLDQGKGIFYSTGSCWHFNTPITANPLYQPSMNLYQPLFLISFFIFKFFLAVKQHC